MILIFLCFYLVLISRHSVCELVEPVSFLSRNPAEASRVWATARRLFLIVALKESFNTAERKATITALDDLPSSLRYNFNEPPGTMSEDRFFLSNELLPRVAASDCSVQSEQSVNDSQHLKRHRLLLLTLQTGSQNNSSRVFLSTNTCSVDE